MLFICSDDDQQAPFAECLQSSVTELTSIWQEIGFASHDLRLQYAEVLNGFQTMIDKAMEQRVRLLMLLNAVIYIYIYIY